jgi:hypothetical protein
VGRPNLLDNIDALLEIATKPKTRKLNIPKQNPEIDKFIEECNIVSGKKKISTAIIYYRYYLHKHIRLIPRHKFFKYFNTKFEKVKTSDGMTYLLNPKGFDITPQGYFRARAYLRQEKDEKKKQKE